MAEPCPTCGFDHEAWQERFGLKDTANEEHLRTIRKLRAEVRRLVRERQTAIEQDPVYPEALEVYEYWRSKPTMPNAREFNDLRRDKVMARLHAGHTVAELKQAVDGCEASSWHMERGLNDLELICRDETKLLGFQSNVETTNGAGPAASGRVPAPKEVERLQDRVERLERDKLHLRDQIDQHFENSRAWRASYHEALDYLELLQHPLAGIAADSMAQRFKVGAWTA